IQDATMKTFETIAMAKVSTSAEEARDMNMLRASDRISMNGDHLIYDAKQLVLSLDEAGYRAPLKQKVPVMGEPGDAAMILAAENMR
ncbi:3-hydroxyacyl-CoA dehydrogenase, partial [Bacillus sp. SIMBA_008]